MPEKILLVIGVTTLCMLSPGPDMVLVMRNALTQGRRIGGLTAFGVLTGNTLHIGYCALGIGVLLSQHPAAYHTLRFASALYMLYLGAQGIRNAGGVLLSEPGAPDGRPRANAYWQGFLNNLLNPKGILFYLGVFSYLITPDMRLGPMALLIAIMVSVSAAF
ncbi:MAG TPA: LysE family translocator, partial [Myxococcota bacterium]|nr:LysE family translocator [Myxococcota bacterium]